MVTTNKLGCVYGCVGGWWLHVTVNQAKDKKLELAVKQLQMDWDQWTPEGYLSVRLAAGVVVTSCSGCLQSSGLMCSTLTVRDKPVGGLVKEIKCPPSGLSHLMAFLTRQSSETLTSPICHEQGQYTAAVETCKRHR